MTRSMLLAAMLVMATRIVAQSGPGGVGTSSTNVLWLRADEGAYSDAGITKVSPGGNVQRWADMSGNARNADQTTLGNRPNYIANVINGKPVMRFSSGNGDRMLATGLSTANRASVWVVAQYSSLPSSNPGLLQGTVAGNSLSSLPGDKNMGMWVASSTTQLWGRGIQTDGTQRNVTLATALATSTPYLLNTVYGATTIDQFVNNAVAGSSATDGTMRSWTDMAIGCQAGTEYWNGDMAEVIHYNITVNSAQRIIISNYLAAKYGVALASNDVYRQDLPAQGNYDHEVAGIGRIDASNTHTDAKGTGVVRISGATGLGDNEFLMWGHNNGTLGTFGVSDLPAGLYGRWARVWRVSERNNTGGSAVDVGAVDITFDLSSFGSVDVAHLRLLVDADGVFNNATVIGPATHLGGGQYRFSGVTALTDGVHFTLGTTNPGTPLPVELVSFHAEVNDPRTVDLDWTTATESNSAHFTVERSGDLNGWFPVVTVSAMGHSATPTIYAAIDVDAPMGLCYYRLRQVDLDGTSTLSQVVAVRMPVSKDMLPAIFPNPSTGPFTIALPGVVDGDVSFELIAATGQGIPLSGAALSAGRYTVDPGHLPPGTYTLRVHVADPPQDHSIRILR